MSVNSRLLKIAGMIRSGDRVADIGTDHAYLPVFLLKNGIAQKAFACDIGDGPLENARLNIERSNVDGIELRKGDGLKAVGPDEIDTAVLAGMGGDLMARIISDTGWIKNTRYELILQPMTAVEELRQYLCENGFAIVKECAVMSQGRIYTVIKAVFDGKTRACDPIFRFIGRLPENMGEDELGYIKRKRRIIGKLADDIKNIESEKQRFCELTAAADGIDRILENYGD